MWIYIFVQEHPCMSTNFQLIKFCTYQCRFTEYVTCFILETQSQVLIQIYMDFQNGRDGGLVVIINLKPMPAYFRLITVFRWINAPGAEAETSSHPWLITMELTVWTHEYLKIMCSQFDSDQFSGFWDMARESQKSGGGGLFKQARLFG